MLDYLKQRKMVIIIGILVIILIGWKIYDNFSFSESDSEEVLTSNIVEKNKEEDMIVVHITGEVKKPGIIKIKEGSRIEDAIQVAGGLTENADISNVNLAYIIEDGIKIKIPSNNDETLEQNYITEDSGKGVIISDDNKNTNQSMVNINTATQAEFEELPGIGPSIAIRIIEYRNQNGKFKSIEDIKSVTGIGNSKFEKIKDLIKVK